MDGGPDDSPSVLLLNTFDTGGAAIASRRILRGLTRLGVDARMHTLSSSTDRPEISEFESIPGRILAKLHPRLDRLPLHLYGGAADTYSVGWVPDGLSRVVSSHDPDVVHMNWMGSGFMNATTPGKIDRPIVWRLPDMWALTGGCHYPGDCDAFTDACGSCPKLDSDRHHDVAWLTHRRKRRSWEDADITVVATSSWLAAQTERSAVLGDARTEIIPNGLDLSVFKPADSSVGRDRFNLPTDHRIVLFGAGNPLGNQRKGFDLLESALRNLADGAEREDLHLVVFGTTDPEEAPDVDIETTCAGFLHDPESLSLLYASADVMVVPSRYEGFGQTVSEALACGTPVVAFDATGPRDIVEHRETGYLAEPYDPSSLAEGIEWVLADTERRAVLSAAAREKAERAYDIETVARQYLELYRDVV